MKVGIAPQFKIKYDCLEQEFNVSSLRLVTSIICTLLGRLDQPKLLTLLLFHFKTFCTNNLNVQKKKKILK